MLTKEERSAIAERAVHFDGETPHYTDIYQCLLGEYPQSRTSVEEDDKIILTRIIDLCDTSNMIELPLDKDGEVIRAGDTVYDKDGDVVEVGGYYYNNGTCKIIIPYGQNGCYINVFPNELTHKKPVTIKSLVERFEHVLAKGQMSYWAVGEICDIVDQLKKLGDSNEA